LQQQKDDLVALFADAADVARRLVPDPSLLQSPESVSPEAVQKGLQQSQPVVVTAPPRVPAPAFVAAWQAMADVVERHRPEESPSIRRCRSVLEEATEDTEQLAAAALRHHLEVLWDWASARALEPQWLYFVSELAARPFLHALAASWADRLDLKVWRARRCPICGRSPNVGIIQGDNFKQLHCPGCGTRWPTRRYACGLCGEDDRGALHFLVADEWPGWRIETCNRCRGYLKVIDYREPGTWSPDQDLFVEDARTLILDEIAQQHGYGKPEGNGGTANGQPV